MIYLKKMYLASALILVTASSSLTYSQNHDVLSSLGLTSSLGSGINFGSLPIIGQLPILSSMPSLSLDIGATTLGAVLGDPAQLLSTVSGIGIPLVLGQSPALNALVSQDIDGLILIVSQGGPLMSPSLAAVPVVPLISAPLF